jgi:hypothetical protein
MQVKGGRCQLLERAVVQEIGLLVAFPVAEPPGQFQQLSAAGSTGHRLACARRCCR